MGPQSPLYLQLRELIRSKIENGEYPPGTAIPSVGTLAEKYGIHRLSVRSAISALIGEGLLKSVQGKGIFVVGEKLEQDLETVGGFEQTLKASAKHFEQRLLVKASRTAGPLYASWLNCLAEEPLYYVKRLSLLDGEPLSLEEAYIPQWLVPNLADVDLNVFPLHEVYEFYGIHLLRGEQSGYHPAGFSRCQAAGRGSQAGGTHPPVRALWQPRAGRWGPRRPRGRTAGGVYSYPHPSR